MGICHRLLLADFQNGFGFRIRIRFSWVKWIRIWIRISDSDLDSDSTVVTGFWTKMDSDSGVVFRKGGLWMRISNTDFELRFEEHFKNHDFEGFRSFCLEIDGRMGSRIKNFYMTGLVQIIVRSLAGFWTRFRRVPCVNVTWILRSIWFWSFSLFLAGNRWSDGLADQKFLHDGVSTNNI